MFRKGQNLCEEKETLMAVKKTLIKEARENLSLVLSPRPYVSYADYYYKKPLFSSLLLRNAGGDSLRDVRVSVSDTEGLVVRKVIVVDEIPYDSSIEILTEDLLSPLYLSRLTEEKTVEVQVELSMENTAILEESVRVTALPFSYTEGTSGNPEHLAGFVRPRLADCQTILREAEAQMKKWDKDAVSVSGYAGTTKNTVRLFAAAVYVAVKRYRLTRRAVHTAAPFSAGEGTKPLSGEAMSPVEVAVFVASCLEAAGLSPLIVLTPTSALCGVWLYDTCFVDPVTDDSADLLYHASEGVSNISLFDVEDIYEGKNTSFTVSERHAVHALDSAPLARAVDVRRARMSQVTPLPLSPRGQEKGDYFDTAPTAIPDAREMSVTKLPKNKLWERRLLDLSMKNALLAFHPKNGLRVFMPRVATLTEKLSELPGAEIAVFPENSEQFKKVQAVAPFTPNADFSVYAEIAAMELGNGILRVAGSRAAAEETVRTLLRRSRSAAEEFGAKVLYLAIGFLTWKREGEKELFRAPLVLFPVRLVKKGGKSGYAVEAEGEGPSVNTTLLEFLKIEFDIDLRGLDARSGEMSVEEILRLVRSALGGRAGWTVTEDIYLAAFSFARYAMWNDIRQNMPLYEKNPLIKSLMTGKNLLSAPEGVREEDDYAPEEILTPLPADSSQFMALAEAESGASFVLHGPPGTGKSQTITNLIANALYKGKRVLFVAEKQAALDVVSKRLSSIGLGEFCLELHSGKTDKDAVIKRLSDTLALRENELPEENAPDSEALAALRDSLRDPVKALHKTRRLGLSIYEAILLCMEYKNAPELFDIESSFYDGLTKEKVAAYTSLLTTAAAAARECGGIHDSPFSGVRISSAENNTRGKIAAAAKVLLAEERNLRNYLNLFLDTVRQKVSILTEKKLYDLSDLASALADRSMQGYFLYGEEEAVTLYSASLRLLRAYEKYDARYKSPIDIHAEYAAVEGELENWGENYRSSAVISSILRKLRRVAKEKLLPEDELRDVEVAVSVQRAVEELSACPHFRRNYVDRIGGFNRKKHRDFVRPLMTFAEVASSVFMDYSGEGFISAAVSLDDGHADTLLSGFVRAIRTFGTAVEEFSTVLLFDKAEVGAEDLLVYYRTKASALIDNLDLLPAFCTYRAAAEELEKRGLSFLTTLLESGNLTADNLVSSFEKNVYRNFLETAIPADPVLSRFSAGVLEDTIEKFRTMAESYDKGAGEKCRRRLIAALPTMDTEGPLSVELLAFRRLSQKMRGMTLRDVLDRIPELLRVTSPCLLMSPITVSKYLAADTSLFDLVVFDEASQLPTCEAVPALARAKAAIVVGDEKQLPPTSFFSTGYTDRDNLENEDMESLLEEWLALGLPERHLTWHYRSKHESLIAFSNAMYYGNRLSTFPSPDAMESHVRFVFARDGVYDRAGGKCNRAEAELLVDEVIRRLSDPRLSASSIGVVTFSTAQQEYIEKLLSRAIAANNLEERAYDREEPLFVKNLENVQGDERDVILFSVCYGPDRNGRISLNFGPLNQYGGWRRLNVAVSRAREEMLIYSSMTSAMIDLSRTGSKGVAGLKAFLEFAEKGRNSIAVRQDDMKLKTRTIGRYIADELRLYGYECRHNVGASDFKIDVAVLDPENKRRFVLAILCDANADYPVRDRDVLQVLTLKRSNWNVLRVFTLNFYNNPKREIKRIKEVLDRILSPEGKHRGDPLARYRKPYRVARLAPYETTAAYVTSGENDADIVSRIRAVVATEEPISKEFLVKRVLSSLGIPKSGARLDAAMERLLSLSGCRSVTENRTTYYFKNEKACAFDRFRVESSDPPLRHSEQDFTVFETVALIRGILEAKISAYTDELLAAVSREFRLARLSDRMTKSVEDAIRYGEEKGIFVRSVSDRISLR